MSILSSYVTALELLPLILRMKACSNIPWLSLSCVCKVLLALFLPLYLSLLVLVNESSQLLLSQRFISIISLYPVMK